MSAAHRIQLTGRITDTGELEISLPSDLPPGEVQVTIEVPADDDVTWEDQPWTDEEIQALSQIEPKTGEEIVAAGHFGGWEEYDITDSVEWLEAQRRKRREQLGW